MTTLGELVDKLDELARLNEKLARLRVLPNALLYNSKEQYREVLDQRDRDIRECHTDIDNLRSEKL